MQNTRYVVQRYYPNSDTWKKAPRVNAAGTWGLADVRKNRQVRTYPGVQFRVFDTIHAVAFA